MSKYNEYAVERVARAISDEESIHYNIPILWDEMTYWQREPYRKQARAALAAIDSLYESEAEEPVEYAGIEGGL